MPLPTAPTPTCVVVDDVDQDGGGAPPVLDAPALAYLAAQGITSETCTAFRVGQVSLAACARLGLTGRRAPGAGGISIPTWLPEAPQQVAGVVRLNFCQSKHRFMSGPVGIAGPVEVATAARVVLVDAPLLAMRLHQDGAAAVALVEDVAVLPALVDWLQGRELVCAAHHGRDLEALRAALAALGMQAPGVLVSMASGYMAAETRAALGVTAARVDDPPAPITPRLLTDLHAYAVGRLATDEGQQALVAFGITDRAVLDAFHMGYLPADFRSALTDADRRTLAGRPWARALVVPACDDQGAIVDLVVAQVAEHGHASGSVWDAPRGMIAPTLATAFPHLIVTDSLRRVGRLFRPSLPALLLRGPADAAANAARLVAGGVERVDLRVQRDPEVMAAALSEVGIVVEGSTERTADVLPFPLPAPVAVVAVASGDSIPVTTPTPSPAPAPVAAPALELISHDAQRDSASFRYGSAIFDVQIPWRAGTVLDVVCRVGERQHRDRLDLAVPVQRRRFAVAAASRTGLERTSVEVALVLLSAAAPALGQRQATAQTLGSVASLAGEPMSPEEHTAALAVLRDDRLLERLSADLDACGWLGEMDSKALVILASVSRLSDEPLWLALTAGAAGERFPALRCLAAITPADHLVHASRLTDNALFNAEPEALRHKLLIMDDVSAISQPVATALRILHTRGSLVGSQVERDALSGGMRTRFTAAHGPLAVIAAAPGPVPALLRHHLLEVPTDESAAQVARTLDARRRSLASPALTQSADQSLARWRCILGLLTPAPVVIPAESDVALPAIVARSRPFQDAAFGLIVASALLHQHQRLRADGAVIATPEDIARGVRLATGLAASRAADLSAQARHLLASLWGAARTTFTMEDLAALLPTWSRWGFRAALDELIRLDCVDAGRSGRGRLREYTLVATPTAYDHGSRAVGELAGVGGTCPPTAIREVVNG